MGNRLDSEEAVDFFARGLINAPFKTAALKDLPHIFELMGSFDPLSTITQEILTGT